MLEQLRVAGEDLRTAINNYLGISSIIHDSLLRDKPLVDLSQEVASSLEREFTSISLYEQKIRQARVKIGHTRNHCTSATPVNKLPFEILARIFHLVSANPCHLPFAHDFWSDNYKRVRYPDRLAHVCSRWRTVALSAPSLWTHIDLTPDLLRGPRTLHRAQAYLKRIGEAPCEAHIDDRGRSSDDDPYEMVEPFLSLVNRAKTVEFGITAHELQSYHSCVLDALRTSCKSNPVKKLRIYSNLSLPKPFILGRDHPQHDNPDYEDEDNFPIANVLWSTEDEISDILAGITTLHLQGVFLDWSSKLYHGLVDLRLTHCLELCPNDAPTIHQHSILSILAKSPGLKVLHFSLDLLPPETRGERTSNAHLGPVLLPELEMLYVSTQGRSRSSNFRIGRFLRLLAPGAKPLRVILETTTVRNESIFGSNDIREFFARSRVEKLCVRDNSLPIEDLQTCRLPSLKILVLDSCIQWFRGPSSLSLKLPTLIIHKGVLSWSEIPRLIKSCPAGLVFSHAIATHKGDIGGIPEDELKAAFPSIRFIEDRRVDYTAGWDIVD